MSDRSRLERVAVQVGRLFAFPFLVLARLIARVTLTLAMAFPVLAVVVVVAIVVAHPSSTELLSKISSLEKLRNIAPILPNVPAVVLMILNAGLVAFLISRYKRRMLESWSALKAHFLERWRRPWIPSLSVGKGITQTWQDVRDIPRSLSFMSRRSLYLAFTGLVISLLLALSSALSNVGLQEEVEKVRTSTEANTKQIDLMDSELEEAMLLGESNSEDIRTHGHPVPPDNGVSSFHLMYDNADLSDGTGICLDDENLKRLVALKAAIRSGCSDQEEMSKLRLKVSGSSSVAPVLAEGKDDNSDKFNRKIANRRADSVVRFLVGADVSNWGTRCYEEFGSERWDDWRQKDEICTTRNQQPPLHECVADIGFQVEYQEWSKDGTAKVRRFDDGSRDNRNRAVEPLNRAVWIDVINGNCFWDQSVANDTVVDSAQGSAASG